jgi:glycosyltransferase involved in cell wall biosynthesis
VKILMVTGAIPDSHAATGSSLVLVGQLAAMSARHEVTLVTFPAASDSEQSALEEWRARGVRVQATGAWIPPGIVRLKRRIQRWVQPQSPDTAREERITGDPLVQATIDRLIAADRFDMIQAENVGVGSFRYPASTPKVMTEHEVGRFGSGHVDSWRTRQPSIWAPFDRLQVFTERDAALVSEVAPGLAERVRVNPFGIDLPPLGTSEQEDAGTLVFVGSFTHGPNVDAVTWFVQNILPGVVARRPSTRLWIVGDAPTPSVAGLAAPGIVVTGRVPDVEPFLRKAAVVVAPVRIGGGMRRKVLEAMALGKAVVTTTLGAEGLAGPLSELPVALADTADAFGEWVSRLLASDTMRRELGARARTFVAARHGWNAYAERLDAVYAELGRR